MVQPAEVDRDFSEVYDPFVLLWQFFRVKCPVDVRAKDGHIGNVIDHNRIRDYRAAIVPVHRILQEPAQDGLKGNMNKIETADIFCYQTAGISSREGWSVTRNRLRMRFELWHDEALD